VWLGKAAPRETPVDIAFVWPAVLGIHRDPNGVFFDDVLEQAVAPVGESSDSLRGLLDLAGQFPEWQFTLAVEPVLLAQLRDMADGYTQTDASGNRVDVSRDDPAAQSAGRVLAAFKDLAAAESVEIAASPFAGPDLGALAAEGWRDGFEQIQLGKQELQQTLGLATPPTGAFAPDPDLTTAGLSYYGQASIDHVLVDAGLAALLTEEMREGTVAVRIRDRENDRVTLVFANGRMRTLMAAPWDTGVFCAGLAAELASGSRDALVVTPGVDFALVPAAYLNAIGEELERSSWLRPQTLTALLRSHSPGTRPVLLSEKVTPPPGYIEATLLEGLRAAHVAVTDLAAVADAARAPVETAHRLLYVAESRWWSRARTSPQEASIGLAYAEQARALAQGELDKVSFSNRRSTTIFGHEGVVNLTVENGADYPVTVELRLSGTGLAFPEGKDLEVELAPGRTEIAVRAVGAEDRQALEALLIAGTTPLDARSQSLRFLTVTAMIPWAVLAVAVIAAASCAVFIWRRRKRAAAA